MNFNTVNTLVNKSIPYLGEGQDFNFKDHFTSIKQETGVINFKELLDKLQAEFKNVSLDDVSSIKLMDEVNLLKKNITVIRDSETPWITRFFDFICPWTAGAKQRQTEKDEMFIELFGLSVEIEHAVKAGNTSERLLQNYVNTINNTQKKDPLLNNLIDDPAFILLSTDTMSSYKTPQLFKKNMLKTFEKAKFLDKDITQSVFSTAMLVAGRKGMGPKDWVQIREYFLSGSFAPTSLDQEYNERNNIEPSLDDKIVLNNCYVIQEAFRKIDSFKPDYTKKIKETISDLSPSAFYIREKSNERQFQADTKNALETFLASDSVQEYERGLLIDLPLKTLNEEITRIQIANGEQNENNILIPEAMVITAKRVLSPTDFQRFKTIFLDAMKVEIQNPSSPAAGLYGTFNQILINHPEL